MNAQLKTPTLWTADEAARYLKMSKKWVYRKALKDEIPCKRFGSRVRFVPSELEQWVASGAKQAAEGLAPVLSIAKE
jgi:excisionase family DNA binding protein